MTVIEARLRLASRVDLHCLCVEIVHAQKHIAEYNQHCLWDRAEWWEAYLERCQEWHMAWVRHRRPTNLFRCPECNRLQADTPQAMHTCFACHRQWLS